MRRLATLAAATLALAALTGCGSSRPASYYALEIPAATVAQPRPIPVTILVGRITAPAIYRDTRIIYQSGPTLMGAYELHRWIDTPSDMLGNLLLRQLRASSAFESVQPRASNATGDFILRGQLFEFNEVDSGGAVSARVSFEIDLFDPSTGRTVWSKLYTSNEPVTGTGVSAVVQGFDRNVRRGLAEVSSGLAAWFAANPPKPRTASSDNR